MSRLPRISGLELIKFFSKQGYTVDHITGSHAILRNIEHLRKLTIPLHSELDTGTLRSIIRDAGFSWYEFIQLYRN